MTPPREKMGFQQSGVIYKNDFSSDSESSSDFSDLEDIVEAAEPAQPVKTWHDRVEVRLAGLRVLVFSRVRTVFHNGRQKSKVAYV